MKKIYVIEITGYNGHPKIWYASKIGRQYEAELFYRGSGVCFKVGAGSFVYPEDCKVVEEHNVVKYEQ